MNKVKVFDAYYKNKAGIWYFVPEDFSLFIKNEPVSGFGSIILKVLFMLERFFSMEKILKNKELDSRISPILN